jgi:hypothetical protein
MVNAAGRNRISCNRGWVLISSVPTGSDYE